MNVLIIGATGFVGRSLYEELADHGVSVVCGSRRPEDAARRFPGRRWVRTDVDDPTSLVEAMARVDAVVYLVHRVGESADYAEREAAAAQRVRDAAAAVGVERIVYLGGVAPAGTASNHLQSRLKTGQILRSGPVPTVELRAGMIVGAGGESWRIVRDLAVRLPVMLLPRWLENRSQPLALADVLVAIRASLDLDLGTHSDASGDGDAGYVFDIPGPEVLTSRQILERIARLRGTRPVSIGVPVLTPSLSAYWIQLVTRADPAVARELVEGLTSDLVATQPLLWDRLPNHQLTSFDEAAAQALAREQGSLGLRTRVVEAAARRVSRSIATEAA